MIKSQESLTAKLCSFARAHHSTYEKNKIFDDYLAYDFMGKEEYEEIGQLIEHSFVADHFDKNKAFNSRNIYPVLTKYILPIPLSRIAFSEHELFEFAKRHHKCQYVICGAGMDTFAFRNENPNISIYEIDHPDTQRYKLDKIKSLEWITPKNVHFIPVDFSKDDMKIALKNTGFNPHLPTFFSILGVTYYLTLSVFQETIRDISELSGKDDKIVFDFPDETTFSEKGEARFKELADITKMLGEPMLHGYTLDEIKGSTNHHGFEIEIHQTPELIQKKYFHNRTDDQTAFQNIHFILATRTEKRS